MIRIGRRNFLLGAGGAVMAIPALEGLVPRAARADAPAPFLLTYLQIMGVCQDVGTGSYPEKFWPTSAPGKISKDTLNADLAAGRSVGHLKEFADSISLVRRVHCLRVEGGTSHNSGAAQVLTGSGFENKTVNFDPVGNPFHSSKALSEDITQRVAREMGGNRYIGVQTAPCADEVAYAINRNDNLGQWQGGTTSNAEQGTTKLYERLFPTVSSSPQELLRGSVNDRVLEDLTALQKSARISSDDRKRLDQFTSSIREIELRMACSVRDGALDAKAHSFGDENDWRSNWDTYEERAKLCNKLSVMAISCGAAHVMQIAAINSLFGKRTDMFDAGSQEYNKGFDISVHQNSHRGDSQFAAHLSQNDKWHMRRFAEILTELGPGPNGFNILDNGVAMFHTDIATGNHECSDIPFILAGSAGGRLKAGQYIDANTTNNKLLATLGAALGLKDNGVPITQFGGKQHDGGTVAGGHIEALKGSKFGT